MAHMVVAHGNKRKNCMFWPFNGMVAATTESNVEKAAANNFKLSFCLLKYEANDDPMTCDGNHPATGSVASDCICRSSILIPIESSIEKPKTHGASRPPLPCSVYGTETHSYDMGGLTDPPHQHGRHSMTVPQGPIRGIATCRNSFVSGTLYLPTLAQY